MGILRLQDFGLQKLRPSEEWMIFPSWEFRHCWTSEDEAGARQIQEIQAGMAEMCVQMASTRPG